MKKNILKRLYFTSTISITVFIVIAILWIIYFITLPSFIPKLANQGLFGDSFGALNTLFTGFAFAGVIISLILQKKELELQRKELKLTRNELANSAISQKKLSSASSKQAFILAKTARLNALATMLDFWNQKKTKHQIERSTKYDSIESIYEKINEVYFELEKLDNDE